MAQLTIWYSVSNGGDGSAYPQWYETERLTEMDQDLMDEGWGECCNGSITVEGDNLKFIDLRITTRQEYIEELKERLKSKYDKHFHTEIKEFIEELEEDIKLNPSVF